jgi:Golgi nucleoside diphosphatase
MLRRLLELLAETIKAWDEFRSENGDIAYFSCLVSTGAQDSLSVIREIFTDLDELRRKLDFRLESCLDRARAVSYFLGSQGQRIPTNNIYPIQLQLRINLENNKAAKHNGVIAEFANLVRPK